jgi:hypothetical protein
MGLGGSVALCDRENNVSVALTVNRLSLENQDLIARVMNIVDEHFDLGTFNISPDAALPSL